MIPASDWRNAPADEVAAEVERLWRPGILTTSGIAAVLGIGEADVWNARARADAERRAA
jgi:hypothetical protein